MKQWLTIVVLGFVGLTVWWFRSPHIEVSLLSLVSQSEQRVPIAVAERGAREVQVVVSAIQEQMAIRVADDIAEALDLRGVGTLRLRMGGMNGTAGRTEFGELLAFYARHRAGLLSAADLACLERGQEASVINAAQTMLWSPMPRLFALQIDPYGFLERFLRTLPMAYGAWKLSPDGYLMAYRKGRVAVLMTLTLLPEVARDPAALEPMVAQLQSLRARFSSAETEVSLSGVPLHTAAIAGKCRREVTLLSLFSLIMIVCVAIWAFRSWRFLPVIIEVILIAGLAGAIGVMLCFKTIHILTCVFSTTLLGLIVDYVFHGLLSTEMPDRTRRCLAYSCLTTELAILPLAFSGISLLVQTACFIGIGLLAALIAVYVFLLPKYKWVVVNQGRMGDVCGVLPRWRKVVVLSLAIMCLVPLWGVRFQTDVTQLYRPSPELLYAEHQFRQLSGTDDPRAGVLVVSGKTLEEVVAREERLTLPPEQPHLARFLPSIGRRQRNSVFIRRFCDLAKPVFAELFDDPSCLDVPLVPKPWRVESLPPLLRKEFLVEAPNNLYALIPCAKLPEQLPDDGVVAYAPRRDLGIFMARFQERALYLLGGVFILLLGVLIGLFRGLFARVFLPSVLGVTAVFSVLTLRGQAVNVFHLLACFMLIGMTVDYSIFLQSGNSPKPIWCSFLTSLSGFGALAFVSFLLIRSMGETFAIGLTVAYVAARLLTPSVKIPEGSMNVPKKTEVGASRVGLFLLFWCYRVFGIRCLHLAAVCVGGCLWMFCVSVRQRVGYFRRLYCFIESMVDKFVVMLNGRGQPRVIADGSSETAAFLEMITAGRGVFMISSHLGVIEVLPAYGKTPIPVHAFMRIEQTSVFNRFYLSRFRRDGVIIHPVTAFGIAETMCAGDALDAGACVLMAGDAPFGRLVTRPFLGRMIPFPIGTFRLAHALGHPIYFVACIRVARGLYQLIARPLPNDSVENCAKQFVSYLEPLVRTHVDQWYQWNNYDGKGNV